MMKKGVTPPQKRMVLSQEGEGGAKKEKEKLSNLLPHRTGRDHEYEDIDWHRVWQKVSVC